jgi:hypothetical protein
MGQPIIELIWKRMVVVSYNIGGGVGVLRDKLILILVGCA